MSQMIENGNMDLKIIIENESLNISLCASSTVHQLKEMIAFVIRQKRCTSLEQYENPNFYRLIFLGHILTPDSKKLSEFSGLASGKSIHLTKRSGLTTHQEYDDSLLRRAESGRVMDRLNNCRVLQRNFRECVQSAQMEIDPNDRPRFDEVENPTPMELEL